MRIPSNTASDTLILQLQRLTTRQSQLQTQVSTGQRITDPSDDPAAMGRVLELQAEQQQLQQFSQNNGRAVEISEASYSAIDELKKISDRAGELSTLGAGVTSPDAYQAYTTELNQLIEQGMQVVNTQFNNEHLFGGTKTDAPPFAAARDANGNITSVSYNGAATAASFRTAEGTQISPFTDGTTNGKFAAFLNNLISLRDALQNGSASGVQATQGALHNSEDDLLTTISGIGATQTRLEADSADSQARFAELQKLTSAETDIDLPQTVVKLTQSQTAYQAALESSAKMMQTSLLDYIR
jgi:flagellar hook-associated protein 3 FlgL